MLHLTKPMLFCKKFTALLLVFTLSIGLFCACENNSAKDSTSNETVKVTLNEVAHSVFYAPLYVAIEEGYFQEAGIDLTLVTGFGADKTMTAVLSGEAEIGFMGPETTVYAVNEGASDAVINFAQLTQRAGNFLIARNKMDTFKWSDLKGKNILGGRAGGMPQMVLEYVLKMNNLDPKKDMSIDQSIDFGSTAAAFSGGQGDFTVEFEPSATALEQEGSGYVVASLGVESGYVPYTAFSAKKSFIEKNPDTIQAFTDALQKGMLYVNAHTSEEVAASISNQFPDTEETTLTTIVNRYKEQDSWKSDLIFSEEAYTLLLDILEEAGELSERPAYSSLVNTDFAAQATKTVK